MTNFQGHVEWCTAVLLHTPCIFSVLHSPRTAEAVGMCKYVCSYWLSVLSPAYLFAHSAMDSPVRVRKVREEACSLLYCWDFKLIFVYLPDFDRLFLWALLRAAGPCDRPVPASSGSVWRYWPNLAAPEAGPAHRLLYDLADAVAHLGRV